MGFGGQRKKNASENSASRAGSPLWEFTFWLLTIGECKDLFLHSISQHANPLDVLLITLFPPSLSIFLPDFLPLPVNLPRGLSAPSDSDHTRDSLQPPGPFPGLSALYLISRLSELIGGISTLVPTS